MLNKKVTILLLSLFSAAFAIPYAFESNQTQVYTYVPAENNKYEKEWAEVAVFESKGLPLSALKLVSEIYDKARQEGNGPQVVKCIIHKLKYKDQREEDAFEDAISEIKTEAEKATFPLRNVLYSTVGELYWWYYQANRWTFLDRSTTVGIEEDDIKTWDLKKLASTAAKHYELSLQDAKKLSTIPTGEYEDVILNASKTTAYRPTLYDVLAHRAIDFYTQGEAGLSQGFDIFKLDKEEYLAPFDQFAQMEIRNNNNADDFNYRALVLMQQLIRLHMNQTEALVDVDLKRLEFVKSQLSNLPNQEEIYRKTLEYSTDKLTEFPAGTRMAFALATFYNQLSNQYLSQESEDYRWLRKKALLLCRSQSAKFPESMGAKQCKNLENSILEKKLDLAVDNVVPVNQAFRTLLEVRNINQLNISIAKLDEIRGFFKSRMSSEEWYDYYVKQPIMKEWQQVLPNPGDYHSHKIDLPMPPLPVGRYVILINEYEELSKKELISVTEISVSNIAYSNRQRKEGGMEYYLSDRLTGQPLKQARASVYVQEYDYASRTNVNRLIRELTSDENGQIKLAPESKAMNSIYCFFTHQGDSLSSLRPGYLYQSRERNYNSTTTHFFTDRKNYRPGQTIYFKGIIIAKNNKESVILKKQSATVEFRDVNNQKISELQLQSNEYGTFHGSFSIPQGILNGTMQISSSNGSIPIQVEEYKRPKFSLEFGNLQGSYKLNSALVAKGKAISFSGVQVSGAEVKYRVVRNANYSYYRWDDYRPANYTETEITQGKTSTDEHGQFEIKFDAIGENKSAEESFTFTVYCDVTDMNGETQSGQMSVSVGTKSLLLSADVPNELDLQAAQAIALRSSNLNGEFISTLTEIKVWKLKNPERLLTKNRFSEPEFYLLSENEFKQQFPYAPYKGDDQIQNWEKQRMVFSSSIQTEPTTTFLPFNGSTMESGKYLIELSATDEFGQEVYWKKYLTLFNSQSKKMPLNSFDWFHLDKNKAEVGENITVLIGSMANKVKVLHEIELNGSIIERKWVEVNAEQQKIVVPVLEKYRGDFMIHFTMVIQGEFYRYSNNIQVPYSNKELTIQFSSFRDKLLPGEQESYKLNISGPKGQKVQAELLTAMYDASLDQFAANNWSLNIYDRAINGSVLSSDNFSLNRGRILFSPNSAKYYNESITYPTLNWFGYSYYYGYGIRGARANMKSAMIMEDAEGMEEDGLNGQGDEIYAASFEFSPPPSNAEPTEKEISATEPIKVRSNFNETAFFYPELLTDPEGNLSISFTIPESLTKWKLMGLAHTTDLKIGSFVKEVVTQKSLMVVSNPPRFFREGDEMKMRVKLSSLCEEQLKGEAKMSFFDAISGEDISHLFIRGNTDLTFSLEEKSSSSLSWQVKVPEGLQAVKFRVEAKSDKFADGEEYYIPVLTNRMLVTESLPITLKGNSSKNYSFKKLLNSGESNTLKHERLTLEFTSNPAWYAVQALPYLIEYPYECAEQLFSRYYANSIAAHIANSNPKIKAVFESWKSEGKDALLSNLEKNQELKSLLLEETPWILEGKDESERKQRLGLLFDLNHIGNELQTTFRKLREMQSPSGAWPWFKGMKDNPYISRHIVSGMGHLRKLDVFDPQKSQKDREMIALAIDYLDGVMTEEYNWLISHKADLKANNLSGAQIHYLYARSFFSDFQMKKENQEAYNYYYNQAKRYWLSNSIYFQGMLALTMHRNNDTEKAKSILASLNEKAIHSEELGMYWKIQNGYDWQNAPIERQALLIEAYSEITTDNASVEEMKLWLLKQKQSQDWKTTRATTEACYALLLEGMDLLDASSETTFRIGENQISTADPLLKQEAGTGYFKTSWSSAEISPNMGNITVSRSADNSENPSAISWGAVYWQYFEQLDKITTHSTPLSIKKQLFVEENRKDGMVIAAISSGTPIAVGDKVIVRIELRVDRDMSYVHMKDMRASGLEPTTVFSGYKYQDGLGYYETTKDASTNFFFDYLRKGTYVFEYPLRSSISGNYSNGITTIQCMYAPEFSSHSEGIRINIAP